MILCSACNREHEPNRYSPFCCRSCNLYAKRLSKPPPSRPSNPDFGKRMSYLRLIRSQKHEIAVRDETIAQLRATIERQAAALREARGKKV